MTDALIGLTIDFNDFEPRQDPAQAPRGGLGSQCFPVAELADDFAGEPQDGLEYLFVVRREASKHPKVHRAANPFEVVHDVVVNQETAQEKQLERPADAWRIAFVEHFEAVRARMHVAPSITTFPPPTHAPLPSPQNVSGWRTFIHGRKIRHKPAPVQSQQKQTLEVTGGIEDGGDMSLDEVKAAALASLELDAPEVIETVPVTPPPQLPTLPGADVPEYTIDPEQPPHAPAPAIILSMPTPHAMRVLAHFNDWLQERIEAYEEALVYVPSTIFAPPSVRRKQQAAATSNSSTRIPTAPVKPTNARRPRANLRPPLPTLHEAHWMLSLLTRVETVLDGDDIATLRELARTLLALLEGSNKAQAAEPGASNGADANAQTQLVKDEEAEAKAHCWMIIAAISSCWKQNDLWTGD